jgi:hypothetical protein
VKALGKRLLILGILAAVTAICADLWQAMTPTVNPPSNAAEWKLSAPPDCGRLVQAEVQSSAETSRARRVCRAEYAGPSAVHLVLFDMPERPGATAFGAFQSWISSERGVGKLGFFKGRYFGVVQSSQADPEALDRFIRAIEKTLP